MMRQRRCTLGARRCEGCPARTRPPASRRRAESNWRASGAQEALHGAFRRHSRPVAMAQAVMGNAEKMYIRLSDGSGLLFPSPTGKALSSGTTRSVLDGSGIVATMLGFLMSFRSWCAENDESRELAEAGLAHVVAGVERAYMLQLLEGRCRLMQAWADYLGCSEAV